MGCPGLVNLSTGYEKRKPNPNPHNFEIICIDEVCGHSLVLLFYPDCTNYDGRKILFFRNIGNDIIKSMKSINPHFLKERGIYPFARFEPTEAGARAAEKLAMVLSIDNNPKNKKP